MKTLLIAALIAFTSLSDAQTPEKPGWGRGMGPGFGGGAGRGERMMDLLDLDSATAVKVGKMRDEHQKERIALEAKLETARVEFRAAMRKDPVDEKGALAKQKEISSIREQMQASALEHRFAVAKLLTPEQRKLFRDHMGRGGAMMGEGFREGGGRGCDCCDDRPMKHRRGERHMRMEREDDRDDD